VVRVDSTSRPDIDQGFDISYIGSVPVSVNVGPFFAQNAHHITTPERIADFSRLSQFPFRLKAHIFIAFNCLLVEIEDAKPYAIKPEPVEAEFQDAAYHNLRQTFIAVSWGYNYARQICRLRFSIIVRQLAVTE
jgi:hypothetical protein